jgi:hypothetical protein
MNSNDPQKNLRQMPFIKATFEARGPLYVMLLIQNIGNMAAVDVRLEIQLMPGDYKKKVLFPLLAPRQKIRFLLPDGNIKVLADTFEFLKLGGECKNLLGEKFQVADTINVKEVMQSWMQSDIALEETVENRLSQVAERIERLERSVERMLARTSGVLIKTPQDQKEELEEIKRFYEEQKQKQKEKEKTSGDS